jgi:hypothetical protein
MYRWPYILNIYTPHGGLFYFGVSHSHDPQNEQFSEIEAFWKQFQPEIAFNEGNTPTVDNKTRNEAIQDAGDPGLVSYLAARDNVKIKSMDPTFTDEVAQLRNRFSPEQLKTFYILRQVPEYDRTPAPELSLDQYLETWIDYLSKVPGLSGPPNSISELRSNFAEHFPDKGAYREAAATLVDPAAAGTVFNEISRASSEYRDRFMAGLIARTVCDHKRVFAVVGGSHVVMQEPAIRKLLSQKCGDGRNHVVTQRK